MITPYTLLLGSIENRAEHTDDISLYFTPWFKLENRAENSDDISLYFTPWFNRK